MRSAKFPRVFISIPSSSQKEQQQKQRCLKYIYICVQVHVCFHSGQIYDLLQQNLVFVKLFSNVHENQVSQCNVSGRNHPQLNITLIWSATSNSLWGCFCLLQLHKALAAFKSCSVPQSPLICCPQSSIFISQIFKKKIKNFQTQLRFV